MRTERKTRLPAAVCLLFAASVLLRFILADFPRSIVIYPDELYYVSMAKSFLTGQGFRLTKYGADFQKILYSLVLAPALLAEDIEVQGRLIALINAAVMSSAIFPVCLLTRDLLDDRRITLLTGALFCLTPDLCYTVTCMSEVLFLPLASWLLYGYYLLIRDPASKLRGPLFGALLGAASYIVYLCKEAALIFPAAWVLFALGEGVFAGRKAERKNLRGTVLCTAGMLAAVGGLYVLTGLSLFRGMGYSYDQSDPGLLLQPGRMGYLLYGFVYCLMNVLLSAGFFPLALPAVCFRDLRPRLKRLYLFLVLLILLLSAGIAYAITVREDFPGPMPRAHMRYFTYVWMPCLALMFGTASSGHGLRGRPAGLCLTALGSLLFLWLYRGAFDASAVDNVVLKWAAAVPFDRFPVRLLFVLGAILGLALFRFRKRLFFPAFLVLLCAAWLLSGVKATRLYSETWRITEEERTRFEPLRRLVRENPDSSFLLLGSFNRMDGTQRLADTFLNEPNVYPAALDPVRDDVLATLPERYRESVRTAAPGAVLSLQGEDGTDLSITPVYPLLYPYVLKRPYGLRQFDYMIVRSDFVVDPDERFCVLLEEAGSSDYTVYALRQPDHLPFFDTTDVQHDGILSLTVREKLFYSLVSDLRCGAFTSTREGFLLYGPYLELQPGGYRIRFHLSCEGERGEDDAVAAVDLSSSSADLSMYRAECGPDDTEPVLGPFTVTEPLQGFETRVYAYAEGVTVRSVDIERLDG